jgi:histidinol-phosphate phosphatase family protein
MTEPASESAAKRPAVFFDRDGVVNRSPGDAYYVLSWDQFEFSPGIFDVLKAVKDRGYIAILVTSQKAVGKGLLSQAGLDDIHRQMQGRLRDEAGCEFDAIYAFTGTPDCRHRPKPNPEMILTAAKEHGIDLSRSWMIGDADRDIEMANAAGLKGTIRVISEKPVTVEATETVDGTDRLATVLAHLL